VRGVPVTFTLVQPLVQTRTSAAMAQADFRNIPVLAIRRHNPEPADGQP
jgi:hypothetical protein